MTKIKKYFHSHEKALLPNRSFSRGHTETQPYLISL